MLRVYNEGDIDGYATEIKDHLPPTLEFVEGEFNDKYNWKVSKDGRTVTTDYLKESKIEKAKKDTNGKIVLSYVEVPIMCKLKDTAKVNEVITNIADITKFTDERQKHNKRQRLRRRQRKTSRRQPITIIIKMKKQERLCARTRRR